ncbi:MAG: LLM class flavin-dependent oxidoreductase [Acidobacteriota bacterium]|nr:LLM class flavin-dependent oxidoreductase [Acidobacteriota bacterium]
MEFWTSTVAAPTRSAAFAERAESDGWDGMLVVDSQNLSGDPYVCLALAARATDRLGVETSVTNPVTRHAAVTASSALSVQRVSRGRMVLGIGRGDSALAHLGRAPARLGWFEEYLDNLQTYLGGKEVPFERAGVAAEAAHPVDTLKLAHAPSASSIRWIGEGPKVPVEVAATGPKVIGIAARHADRVMLALGADPKRVAWGIETARRAAAEAGRDPESLRFGAYINVVCHEDPATAREIGRASTGLFARFSAMYGEVSGPADEAQSEVFRNLHARYDMNAHGQHGSQQTTALTDEFIDGYAIVGGADHCVERFETLVELGLDKFAVAGPNLAAKPPEAREAAAQLTSEVLPRLRA